MGFHFATCERKRALEFLKEVYPSREVLDTPEDAGPLLDLVEKDIVRIQDPMMHGKSPQVIQGSHFKPEMMGNVQSVAQAFHDLVE